MRLSKAGLMAGVALCGLILAGCGGGMSLGTSTGAGGGVSSPAGGGGDQSANNGGGTGGDQTANNGGGTGAGNGGSNGAGNGTGNNGGTGAGTGNGGGQQAGNLTGNGTVTVTAAGTTVSTPPLLGGPLAPVGTAVNSVGTTLASAGNALLPTQVTSALQSVTTSLPLTANVADNQLGGAPTQSIGVSLLSSTPASGTLASANLLSAGQTAGVSVLPNGLAPVLNGAGAGAVTGAVTPVVNTVTAAASPVTAALSPVTSALPLTTTRGDGTLTGGARAQPIGVSLLSPTQAAGTAATVGVLSGGNIVTANVNGAGTQALLAGTPVVGNVLNGTSSLANATLGNQKLITGANPLAGASVASPTQSTGSVATAGVGSGGKALTVGLGGHNILSLGH